MNRILSRIIKPIRQTQKYDESTYWNKRQDPNAVEGWEPEHLQTTINYIIEHISDCHTILEIGPGVGRTLPAYTPDLSIQCYEISSLYKERLFTCAKELKLNIGLDIATQKNQVLPYNDKQFDAGVACQVFLHQRPENIEKMMHEMSRTCKKVVVITGGYMMTGADHVFSHDYPAICTAIGCEMHYVRALPPHIFFVYKRIKLLYK